MITSVIKRGILSFYIVFMLLLTSILGLYLVQDSKECWCAEASIIFVDQTGGGHYITIQDAINNATPGDTIIVANGTYYESVNINKSNINLIGNSTTDCKIIHHYDGSGVNFNYSAGINITSSGVNVTGFNISVSGDYTFGIWLNSSNSSNSNVTNNNITTTGNYGYGIYLYNTSNNKILSNSISTQNSRGYGIFLEKSPKNNLMNNSILTSQWVSYGINIVELSNYNTIINNTIKTLNGGSNGIQISSSYNNELIGNFINTTNFWSYGIYVISNSENNNLSQNIILTYESNSHGIYLPSNAINNNLVNNTINCSGSNSFGIYLYFSNQNNLTSNTINMLTDSQAGIYLSGASNNNISKNLINILEGVCNGFYIFRSSNNNFTDNIIKNSEEGGDGVDIYSSSNNLLKNNSIEAFGNGIYLSYCERMKILENNLTNCSVIINSNQLVHWNSHVIDINNTINSDPVYYYRNTSGIKVPVGAGEVIFANCTYMTVSNQTLPIAGIYVAFTNFSKIDNNSINNGGIYLISANNNTIISNKNITNGSIDLFYDSNRNTIKSNTIRSLTNFENGIYIYSSSENEITQNVVDTTGYGIFLTYDSNNNNLTTNTIKTYDIDGDGIYVFESLNNNLINNDIETYGINGDGILLQQNSDYNLLKNNKIDTYNLGGYGIYNYATSNNQINGNIINIKTSGSRGVSLSYCSNTVLNENQIYTSASDSYGVTLQYSSNNNIKNNDVKTIGENSYGVWLYFSDNNEIIDNVITTLDDYAVGIYIYRSSNDNEIENNIVKTSGIIAYGIAINDSNNVLVKNCDINTTGIGAHGFYLDGFETIIINSSIAVNSSSMSYTIITIKNGNITTINCSFDTVQVTENGGGVVFVKNYLTVQIIEFDEITPIPGVDVEVTDNGNQIFGTPGYGGIESKTNNKGLIEDILVQDRWYNHNNVPIENETEVKVKKELEVLWEAIRDEINMGTSHTEIFIAYANLVPSTPIGLKVTRLPESNTLNISWYPNSNTIDYTVYTNKSGDWEVLINISHPQTWVLDENLEDENWYYYRLRAWGVHGISSGYTSVISYYLDDILPPDIPKGINVSPVLGGDELNISWNLNQDDTIYYNLWWEEPLTLKWLQVGNISHPKNWYILSNETLRDGETYYFKLRAWDDAGLSSPYSVEVSGVHRDYLAPAAPTKLKAESILKSIIKLSWKPSLDSDVINYWIYINQSGASSGGPYELRGKTNSFTFDYTVSNLIEDTIYYFVVAAVDEANNSSPYSTEAWNTTLPDLNKPKIINTTPSHNSEDVSVDTQVKIVFDMQMNTDSVSNVLVIIPTINYSLNWGESNTVLYIKFLENLSYNTSYTITIGSAKAKASGTLKDWPFILRFKTEVQEKPQQKPIIIMITEPKANELVKPGDLVVVKGVSQGLDEGEEVIVTFGDAVETSLISAKGNWSVVITAPLISGDYNITVIIDNLNYSIPVIVKDTDKPDEDKDKSFLRMGPMIDLLVIFLIVIVIIIIILVLIIKNKKQKDTEEIEDFGEILEELEMPEEEFEDDELAEDELTIGDDEEGGEVVEEEEWAEDELTIDEDEDREDELIEEEWDEDELTVDETEPGDKEEIEWDEE